MVSADIATGAAVLRAPDAQRAGLGLAVRRALRGHDALEIRAAGGLVVGLGGGCERREREHAGDQQAAQRGEAGNGSHRDTASCWTAIWGNLRTCTTSVARPERLADTTYVQQG